MRGPGVLKISVYPAVQGQPSERQEYYELGVYVSFLRAIWAQHQSASNARNAAGIENRTFLILFYFLSLNGWIGKLEGWFCEALFVVKGGPSEASFIRCLLLYFFIQNVCASRIHNRPPPPSFSLCLRLNAMLAFRSVAQ